MACLRLVDSRFGREQPKHPVMDVTAASSLSAMATTADDAVDTTLLKKALDVQSQSMAQLLQTLPSPPQIDGKGATVNTYA